MFVEELMELHFLAIGLDVYSSLQLEGYIEGCYGQFE